jgi:penicillin amidase
MVWVVIAVGVIALGAGALYGRWWLFRKGLPRIDGAVQVPGISAAVEIIRDTDGIPHIFAASIEDAAFGHGFVHAQDRLWQMELSRRIGAGRLSEFAGKAALEADRFLRRVGLRRAAQREADQLLPEERSVLMAYARGVNAAVEEMGPNLPLELRLLRIRPEPWSIVDSLSWAKVMALNLSVNWEIELFRARLVAKVGVERAVQLHLPHFPGAPPIVPSPQPPGTQALETPPLPNIDGSAAELLELYNQAKAYLPFGELGASNNWVVAGTRTASGRPMLANDPHLALQLPNLWHEAHLVAPGLDVYGAGLPGSPGVVLGHSRKVAWGFTNAGADVQDLYIERFDPKSPDQYEAPEGWRTVERIRETIRIKGGREVVEEVCVTRHGPVMVGGPAGGKGPALALKWTSFEPGHAVAAVLAMNRAVDASAFREALRLWPGPTQNAVFADGRNIGYLMIGEVPVRRKGSGFLPVPGWVDDYEWTGRIPFDELPQLWNPESGMIVTANNPVVDRGFPRHISWDWMNGYRAARIEHLLREKPKLTAEDFGMIQRDVYCVPGLAFARQCGRLTPKDPVEQQALATLVTWDGFAHPESAGAVIYEAMLLAAVRRAFEPELGKELLEEMIGRSPAPLVPATLILGRYVGLLLGALERKDRSVFAPSAETEPWNPILAGALSDAVKQLRKKMGDDVRQWQWGQLHRLRLQHPLAAAKPLHLVFEGRDVPVGGNTDTPFQTAYPPHKPFGADAWAPSWRQVVDMADPRKALSIHATGQSGHTRTRHHLDFFEKWYRGDFHPHWMDREDVTAHAEATLRLEPKR